MHTSWDVVYMLVGTWDVSSTDSVFLIDWEDGVDSTVDRNPLIASVKWEISCSGVVGLVGNLVVYIFCVSFSVSTWDEVASECCDSLWNLLVFGGSGMNKVMGAVGSNFGSMTGNEWHSNYKKIL